MRTLPPFRYMRWAKSLHDGARYHLGASGLSPPPRELLALDGPGPDLTQRGSDGPPEVQARLAARLGVPETEVALAVGTSHALYLACGALLSPGDLCLVETPAYEVLASLPLLFGAEVRRFERRLEDGYRLPPELPQRIVRERPALVIVSNPHNPSGALLSLDELAPTVHAARAAGARVLADEVYLEYLEDAPERSARRLGALSCASFTKAYGLGTVRFGWLTAPEAVVSAALSLNDYIAVLYPNPCAWVGLRALAALEGLQRRAASIRAQNFPILRDFVEARPELRWHPPEAGVVGFPRIAGLEDSSDFCARLHRERGTLIVPGSFFEAPAHVRLAFGSEPAVLRRGLAELGAALDALG